VISMEKNSPSPPFRFRIRTYPHFDDDGIKTDRRELSFQCQENGQIKFTLRRVDDVWKCEVENLPTGEIISKITVESPEQLKKELIKFNFSDESNVEERYRAIVEHISENKTELNLVTGRKGVKKSLYDWAELVNKRLGCTGLIKIVTISTISTEKPPLNTTALGQLLGLYGRSRQSRGLRMRISIPTAIS